MNVEQLRKQLNKDVKLRPPAQFQRSVGDWIPVDWEWRVVNIDSKERRVDLQGHDYGFPLMSDHIKEFMRSSGSHFEGFLLLRVAVFIQGNKITVEPQT